VKSSIYVIKGLQLLTMPSDSMLYPIASFNKTWSNMTATNDIMKEPT